MKRKIYFLGILAIVALVTSVILSVLPVTAVDVSTIEVSQPIQLTNDGHYERGQSIVYDGANYWLFYGRSASYTGTYQTGDPDIYDYALYYKKASTVAGLASATATAVTSETIQPTGFHNGETGAAYYDGKVWAFAPIEDPDHPVRGAVYGWYTTDGSSWTAVGPFWGNKLYGSLHHDEVSFGGELWIVQGTAAGNITTRHGNPYDPTTQNWVDSELGINLGSGGGIIHFFVDSGELYLAGLKCTEPKANVIYHYNSASNTWDAVANVPSAGDDPTLFKAGSTYVFAQAPWVSTGGGRQYTIAWSSDTLDGTFFSRTGDPVSVTEGKYGANTWTDMWPIGFTDAGGNSYLFFTSERNPDNPSSEIAGNIWYLPVTWDVSRGHYTYIQEAVDAAISGDTINVAAGTYDETFTVNKPLELRGAKYGIDARTRDAAGETILDTPLSGVIYLSANNIIMDGFTIESDTGSGRVEPNGNNIQFLNNIIKRTVYPRGNPSDMTFRYNLFRDTASTETIYGTGLYFEPSSASGSIVEYNEFRDLHYSGIILAGTSTPYTDTIISHNDIYRTQSQGINIAGNQAGLTISYNYIEQANLIHGADKSGIRLYGSAFSGTVNIINNTCNNCFNGIAIRDGENIAGKDIHVNYNKLINNFNAGVYNGGTGILDATKNWWGSASGPTHGSNPGGTGQVVTNNVIYDPWYNSAEMTVLASNKPVHNSTHDMYYDTIQQAINAATDGDTINVAAGTYTAAIDITKRIILQGAGSNNVTGTVLQNTISQIPVAGSPYSYKPVVIISANGTDGNPLTLKDLMIRPRQDVVTGAQLPGILPRPGLTISYIELDNVRIVGTQSSGTAESGITLDDHSSFNHLVINNCEFRDMGYGIIFFNNSNTLTMAQNIQIIDTTFDRNSIKGFYAEKLSNTTFTNVTITNNGNTTLAPFWAQPNNAGIDINLKFGDYVNIIFNNLTVTGNGVGSTNGAGLTVKARGTGSDTSYSSLPATLDTVTINGGTFTGNEAGIRFGEPGKNNTGPTNITIHNATITGNTQFGLSNVLSGSTINATDNWWGSANGPTHTGNRYNISSQGSVVIGAVNYAPWLTSEGGASFAPVTNGANSFASIQAAINAASEGNTINVEPGIYSESVTIEINNLTINGNAILRPIINGGLKLDTDLAGLTFSNFYVSGNATIDNTIVRMYGTITNLNVNNCVFDGENAVGRYGFTGGQIEGNLTIANSEFKDIAGWAVLDTRSGSGGDGSAMGTVTFHNNYVHDCDGSIVFRGLSSDWTDNVYIYDNVFENIGEAGVSEHWAAFEVNRANNVEIYHNRISGVVQSSGDEGEAMQLWQVGTVDIHDNNIADNYMGIAILKWPTDATYSVANILIHSNNFTGNTVYALKVEDGLTGGQLNATNNYWGSANGPQHTGNKYNIGHQGDVVLGAVNYAPWLRTAGGMSFGPVTNGLNKFASIQAAIDAASDGDTINAAAGNYTEQININKSLTITGAGADTTNIISPDPATMTIYDAYGSQSPNSRYIVHRGTNIPVVRIVASNVRFSGFHVNLYNYTFWDVKGSYSTPYSRGVGILVDHVETVLGTPDVFTGINIQNNKVDGLKSGDRGDCIKVLGSATATVTGNTLYGGESGINIQAVDSPVRGQYYPTVTVNSNTIYSSGPSNGPFGIGFWSCATGSADGNTIYNDPVNNGYALNVWGSRPVSLTNNHVTTLDGAGIGGLGAQIIESTNVIFTNNRIENQALAVGIWSNPTLTMTGNTITNCTDGIVIDQQTSGAITIHNNSISGIATGHYAVKVGGTAGADSGTSWGTWTGPSTVTVDATNNWWGTSNAISVALKMSSNVNYDPWHLKPLSALATDQVTRDSIDLRWTAESVWGGNYYDFRYATTPINTAADWNNATRISGEPLSANGTQEMIIRGLTGGTRYYFGFTLVDGNNVSDISKIDVTTLVNAVIDNTAPNAIADLAISAGSPASTSIVLTWTATGDDGTVGFAMKYIIKRSNAPITAINFDAATTVFNNLTPKASGQPESFTVNKLNPNTRYYFAIKVQDEVPNTSTISNIIDIFTANLLPAVTGISPASMDNGEARTLTFTGTNFAGAGATQVRLVSGENVISLTGVTINSDTELTAIVPKGAPTGTYQARITNNNGTSTLSSVTYTVTVAIVPFPVVTNVIPNMATNNTIVYSVEIFGEHFTGATAVTIDGQTATIITITETKITVNMPGIAAGEYDVKVTTPGGTNDISAVKFIVIDPVIINADTTEDTTTSGVVDLGDTNVIPVQITMTTDDSENATRNTDDNVEIEVVISSNTAVTDSHGNAYSGTLNPPRVVKPDTTVQTDLPEDAIVIEMGNPDQTINFSQDFVAVVKITATNIPDIYYFNKNNGRYELAGKAGVKDGISYEPGGTVLGEDNGTYTIGLLLDHMSVYVSSTTTLLAPTPNPNPGGGGSHSPPLPQPLPPGTTNIQGQVTSSGRFLASVTAASVDTVCQLYISANTVGLDQDLHPLTKVTIFTVEQPPSLPNDWHIVGLAYDLGPGGSSFDPAIILTFKYDPATLPENTNVENLVLAYYNEATSKWVKLDSEVDAANNKITAGITHFTIFALVTVPKPAAFTISSLSISPSSVVAGEKVTISIIATNTGDVDGNYTATLHINGVKEAEQSFTLAPGAARTISFDVVKENAGIYSFNLNGLISSFTITAAPTLEPTPTPEPTPSTALKPTTTPTPLTAPAAASVTATNWGIITGVIVGIVVVVVGIVWLLLYILWRKRRLDRI
jgi:hypothetical protein